MKLELIKETDIKGKVWYYIHQDGMFLSGTLTNEEDQGRKMYQTIKEGITAKKEVIVSDNL